MLLVVSSDFPKCLRAVVPRGETRKIIGTVVMVVACSAYVGGKLGCGSVRRRGWDRGHVISIVPSANLLQCGVYQPQAIRCGGPAASWALNIAVRAAY